MTKFAALLAIFVAGCATEQTRYTAAGFEDARPLTFRLLDERTDQAKAGRTYRGALGSERTLADDALVPPLVTRLGAEIQREMGDEIKGGEVRVQQLSIVIADGTPPIGSTSGSSVALGLGGVAGVLLENAVQNRRNVRTTYVTLKSLVNGREVRGEGVISHGEAMPTETQLNEVTRTAISDFIRAAKAVIPEK